MRFKVLLLSSLIVSALGCAVSIPWQAPAGARAVTAETTVSPAIGSVSDLVLHDHNRNKDLHIRITHPSKQGTYPAIVFSHGAGGSKDSYRYLAEHWAQNGFMVVQPTHADTLGKDGLRRLLSIIRSIPKDYAGWNNRFKDVSFVLDSVTELEKAAGVKIDQARIGVGGHSYGAFTAVVIGGGKIPAAAREAAGGEQARDKRAKAILVVSPQGVSAKAGDFGFDDKAAWQELQLPAMFMTGTYDQTGFTRGTDRKVAFTCSPDGDKYFVNIEGANHMTFAGRNRQPVQKMTLGDRLSRRLGPDEKGDHEELLNAIKLSSTTFWNAYLKNDKDSRKALSSKSLESENALIKLESK